MNDKLLDDRSLVAKLIAGSDSAWECLVLQLARPLAEIRKYREMTERFGLSTDEILAQLCVELQKDNCARLRAFRFNGTLDAWLYWEVRNAFRVLVRKLRPDEERFDPTEEGEITERLSTRPDYARDALEEARSHLVSLWHRSPVAAYALLMKGEIGMSSEHVGQLLGKNAAAVDKMVSRARQTLREIAAGAE